MPSDPRDCLCQILTSAQEIREFIEGRSLLAYQQTRQLKLSVERLLQILTQAAYRLGPDAAAVCPEVDWNGVRGLGNFLRHEYDRISDATIWNVLQQRLPTLVAAVQRALDELREKQESA